MGRQAFADTVGEVARIQGGVAPEIHTVLSGETRLTGRWRNEPFESYMPPTNEHILVAKFAGVGDAVAKIDGKLLSGRSDAGTITLSPRGHDGYWRVDGVVEVSNIYLGHARLQACADEMAGGRNFELFDRVNFAEPNLFAIMKLLCDEAKYPAPASRLFLDRGIDLLCLQLLRAHSSLAGPFVSSPNRGLADWQIRTVTDFMRDHLADDIGLQEIADLLRLSRFHFCTAFRMATGFTPLQWLTTQRMAYARTLLAKPHISITEIALAVGYQTPSAFSAAFRKSSGLTPTQYRRRLI